jgi:hypothetical protein
MGLSSAKITRWIGKHTVPWIVVICHSGRNTSIRIQRRVHASGHQFLKFVQTFFMNQADHVGDILVRSFHRHGYTRPVFDFHADKGLLAGKHFLAAR